MSSPKGNRSSSEQFTQWQKPESYVGKRVVAAGDISQAHGCIRGTVIQVFPNHDPVKARYHILYDNKDEEILFHEDRYAKRDLMRLLQNYARLGEAPTDEDPIRRSVRKRKLKPIRIGNFSVLAPSTNEMKQTQIFEDVIETKKVPTSIRPSKSTSKPPNKEDSDVTKKAKKHKAVSSSTKILDERFLSSVIPPEIFKRFFHLSGNGEKTKELTLKKQTRNGSSTKKFCCRIVAPIVRQDNIHISPLYFVIHFDVEEKMLYLTPLFRNGIVKTTGMIKYCINIIPPIGPINADTCWETLNIIHVPCHDWRIVESRTVYKTSDVRSEQWEILNPAYDTMTFPDIKKRRRSPVSTKSEDDSISSPHSQDISTSLDKEKGKLRENESKNHDERHCTINDDSDCDSLQLFSINNLDLSDKVPKNHDEIIGISSENPDIDSLWIISQSNSNSDINTGRQSAPILSPPKNDRILKLHDDDSQCFNAPCLNRSDPHLNHDTHVSVLKSPNGVDLSKELNKTIPIYIGNSVSVLSQNGKVESDEKLDDQSQINHDNLDQITFEQGMEHLRDFRNVHEHVNVPWNYSAVSWLFPWCSKLRQEYRKIKEQKSCSSANLSVVQINRLTEIGFDFHDSSSEIFDKQLNELKEFKRIYGSKWFEPWRNKLRADAAKKKLDGHATRLTRLTTKRSSLKIIPESRQTSLNPVSMSWFSRECFLFLFLTRHTLT